MVNSCINNPLWNEHEIEIVQKAMQVLTQKEKEVEAIASNLLSSQLLNSQFPSIMNASKKFVQLPVKPAETSFSLLIDRLIPKFEGSIDDVSEFNRDVNTAMQDVNAIMQHVNTKKDVAIPDLAPAGSLQAFLQVMSDGFRVYAAQVSGTTINHSMLDELRVDAAQESGTTINFENSDYYHGQKFLVAFKAYLDKGGDHSDYTASQISELLTRLEKSFLHLSYHKLVKMSYDFSPLETFLLILMQSQCEDSMAYFNKSQLICDFIDLDPDNRRKKLLSEVVKDAKFEEFAIEKINEIGEITASFLGATDPQEKISFALKVINHRQSDLFKRITILDATCLASSNVKEVTVCLKRMALNSAKEAIKYARIIDSGTS